MNVELLQRFVRAREDKETAQAMLDEAKRRFDLIERSVVEEFALEGISSTKIDVAGGGQCTVHLHRQTWARLREGHDTSEVVPALKAAGLGDLVKEQYNASTLSAWVRNARAEGRELPVELAAVIEPVEEIGARVLRSKATK